VTSVTKVRSACT